jgi:Arc/MetJ family transcription regulator
MQVPKTLIDVDEHLLAEAQRILGTRTKKATVNAALGEVVRRWSAAEFGRLARSGTFDGLLRAEPEQGTCQ